MRLFATFFAIVLCTLMLVIYLASCKNVLKKKSIVFDPKTPNVFYCPQQKPSSSEKMIVRSRPLEKLCEFSGKQRPKNEPKDCYNDLDETEYACEEKKRFQVRLELTELQVSENKTLIKL